MALESTLLGSRKPRDKTLGSKRPGNEKFRSPGILTTGTSTDALVELHDDIDACTICEELAVPFVKPTRMQRGNGRRVVIVGQEPGRKEVAKQVAFSGGAGTRLDRWLVGSGASEEDPRADVYLTSVLKCPSNGGASFQAMFRNCRAFLQRQLRIIKPELLVTLGRPAYDALDLPITYAKALCSLVVPREHVLFFDFEVNLVMPWCWGAGRMMSAAA